jgi:ech hydrogenase subunit D
MAQEQKTIVIETRELVGKAAEYASNGFRLVQICAVKLPEHIELNYSFDKNYLFENLRLLIRPEDEIPSISLVFWSAFIYENEIHDLYSINIKNINIDYGGKFYRTGVKGAFSRLGGAAAPDKDKG